MFLSDHAQTDLVYMDPTYREHDYDDSDDDHGW